MPWTTREFPANENGRGNLSGYEATCGRCGLVLRNSTESGLGFDAADHDRFHAEGSLERGVERRVS